MIHFLRLRLGIFQASHLQILIPTDQRLSNNFGRKKQIKIFLRFLRVDLTISPLLLTLLSFSVIPIALYLVILIFLISKIVSLLRQAIYIDQAQTETRMQAEDVGILVRVLEVEILNGKLAFVIHD